MRSLVSASLCLATAAAAALSAAPVAWAQPGGGFGSTPMAIDLKKAALGSWAEYQVAVGEQPARARWALVGRSNDAATIEMSMEGGPAAAVGGKMIMRLVLEPDPTKAERPVKQMVMQIEGKDPMEMPNNGPVQKFEKPDPKKLVGKETIKVAAGSFPTSHYRDSHPQGTIDIWISDQIPPLGLVKLMVTPKEAGGQMPKVSMELSGKGKDAKAQITKKPKPFDPAAMMGMARPPSAPRMPAPTPSAPPAAPPAAK